MESLDAGPSQYEVLLLPAIVTALERYTEQFGHQSKPSD